MLIAGHVEIKQKDNGLKLKESFRLDVRQKTFTIMAVKH